VIGLSDPNDMSGAQLVTVVPGFYQDLSPRTVSGQRFGFLLDTVRAYHQLNLANSAAFPLVVVDRSSKNVHEQVREAVRECGSAYFLDGAPSGGIFPQSAYGIRFALDHGATRLARHAPEKEGWARINLLHPIISELDGGVDLLAVGRNQVAMNQLPANQRVSESVIWRLLGRLKHAATGTYLCEDSASGYRAMTAAGAKHLLTFDWELYGAQWQFEWISYMQAIEQGRIKAGGLLLPFLTSSLTFDMENGNPYFDENRVMQAADVVLPQVLAYALANGWELDRDPRIQWSVHLNN